MITLNTGVAKVPDGQGGFTPIPAIAAPQIDDTTASPDHPWSGAKVAQELAVKQATISDLETIRSGAAAGATALQEVPNTYRTAAAQDVIDGAIQSQIDALVSKSDVVDVVGTYAELQAYDTSTLLNNDVVKVLSDSTHNDGRSYYRWTISGSAGAWSYIGTESVGYTKAETDAAIAAAIGNAIGGEY